MLALAIRERLASHWCSSETSSQGIPSGCSFGVSVRLLAASNPAVCGDPADSGPIVSREYLGADLHRRDSETLVRADGACPDSVGSGGGVYEHGVPVSALLALVEDARSLVGGIGLRAKALLVSAEVIASAGPPPWGLLDACRSPPPLLSVVRVYATNWMTDGRRKQERFLSVVVTTKDVYTNLSYPHTSRCM